MRQAPVESPAPEIIRKKIEIGLLSHQLLVTLRVGLMTFSTQEKR